MDNGPIPGVQIITPTVHFAPDVTDTNALIMITSDEIVDEGRTLSLTLMNPTGGTIGTQNSLTIVKIVEYQDCKFIFIFSPVFPVFPPYVLWSISSSTACLWFLCYFFAMLMMYVYFDDKDDCHYINCNI